MKTSLGTIILSTLTLLSVVDTTASAQPQWALDTVIVIGTNSSGIAITHDGSKLVVSINGNPGSVKIISTSGYAISTVDVSSVENYPNGVTITPNDSTALVNTTHNTIFINLKSNTIKSHFPAPCVGTTLYGIAVTPNGQNGLYPDLSSGCTQQGLRSINATTPSGSTFAQVVTSGVLYGIAITPDSASAIITTFSSDVPKKINLASSAVQNITGFSGSYGVASLHHTNEALIEGDSLKRVSLTSNTATKVISDIYSTSLQSIAITADDKYAFVVGSFAKIVVDLATNTVIQTFTAGATSVATMPDGSRFYVTDSFNGTVRVYKKTNPTGVERNTATIPSGYGLSQNFPNPFNPTTVIAYQIGRTGNVSLKVFDLLGREVKTLIDERQDAGSHSATFGAGTLPSGMYFYKLESGNYIDVKKLVLLK